MAKAIVCIVKAEDQAEQLLNQLKQAEFSAQEVSIVTQDRREQRSLSHGALHARAGGLATGAVAGGLLAGGVGWLVGMATLAIPGIGPLIAAGPIAAALGDAAIGGAFGALGGAIVGMRLPDHLARYYEDALQNGHVLVAVHTDDLAKQQKARDIFQSAGGEHISDVEESKI
jgi:uncharacterized membrane protein